MKVIQQLSLSLCNFSGNLKPFQNKNIICKWASIFYVFFSANAIIFDKSDKRVCVQWIQSGHLRNKARLSPQMVGEALLYPPPTLSSTMVKNHEYLLMVARLTGASFGTSYCKLWEKSRPGPCHRSNPVTVQGVVMYPILSQPSCHIPATFTAQGQACAGMGPWEGRYTETDRAGLELFCTRRVTRSWGVPLFNG